MGDKLKLRGLILIIWLLTSCSQLPIASGISVRLNLSGLNIGIGQKIQIQALVFNPNRHSLEFRFTSDRGYILSTSTESPIAEYVAPFSGGEDIVRLNVFDRNDNANLPLIQERLLIFGDGVAYVELPQGQATLSDADNGVI